MKFNLWSSAQNVMYRFILGVLIVLITLSIIIAYFINPSIWFTASIKMILAEHFINVILILTASTFILLQLLSRKNVFRLMLEEPLEYPEKDEKIYLLAVILLTVIGFYLRFINLNNQSLWMDEAITANAAISTLQNGIPIFSSGVIYKVGILNTLIVALSLKIFGVNEFAGRLPGIIFGTLSILMTYLLGKKLGNKNIGLAAAILMTFSLWNIAGSRQVRMYVQLQFFYLASLYLFYVIIEEKKIKYILLFIVMFISALLSHSFAYSLIAIFLAYLISTRIGEGIKILSNYRTHVKNPKIHLGFLIALLYIVVLWKLFERRFMDVISLITNTNDQFIFYKTVLADTYQNLYYFFIAGVLIAIGVMLIMKRKKELLLVIAFFIPFYIISYHLPFIGLGYGARYLFFILPIFFIFSIYLIGWLIEIQKIDRLSITHQQIISICIIIVIMSVIISSSSDAFSFSYKEYYSMNLDSSYTNHKKAFSFVKNNMQESDKLISLVPPLALYYTGKSDYSLLSKDYETFSTYTNGNWHEIYANSIVLLNKSMFEQVLEDNNRGWVVVDKIYADSTSEDILKFIEEKMSYHKEISDKMTKVYSWDTAYDKYSDNFDTNKWINDIYSSYGIERSKDIIHTKYVLYPILTDTQTYVKYHLSFNNTINESTITVTGNRRDNEHKLTVWASSDNNTYTKIIEFDKPEDTTEQADITSYIKNNQTWIEFRFFRSREGENTPRILDFSITAIPKYNETVEITPFRKKGQKVSAVEVSLYNSTNLIKESSFEHYKNSDKSPIYWSFTSDNDAQAGIDTSASVGNYSFRISVKNATSGNADLNQLFAINGSRYLFSISYKYMGSGNMSALLQWMDAQGKGTGTERLDLYPNTSWNIFSSGKYIPQNTIRGKVTLRYQTQKGDSGTVWFDDVRLYSARED